MQWHYFHHSPVHTTFFVFLPGGGGAGEQAKCAELFDIPAAVQNAHLFSPFMCQNCRTSQLLPALVLALWPLSCSCFSRKWVSLVLRTPTGYLVPDIEDARAFPCGQRPISTEEVPWKFQVMVVAFLGFSEDKRNAKIHLWHLSHQPWT